MTDTRGQDFPRNFMANMNDRTVDTRLIHELSGSLAQQLHEMYKKEWWSKNRDPEDIRRMLANSDYVFALTDSSGSRLLAFARVISDRVYKALILDVIVHESVRSRKYGEQIMKAIVQHPEIRRIRHVELYCMPEMDAFYQKWGFTADVGGAHLMRKYNVK